MFASKTLRVLTLAAALVAPMMAGVAHAEQTMVPPGATASGRWIATPGRTMLSAPATTAQQNFLQQSGATGADGQHS